MNKSELVAAVAAKAGITKVAAAAALDATMDVVAEAVQKGEGVQLVGFGTLSVVEKPARTGVNPSNGQKIQIPARKAVKFKAGSKLTIE